MLGQGRNDAVDATSTILPRRRASIGGSKSRVSSVSATMLTCMISALRTGSIRSNRPIAPSPALLTSTSISIPGRSDLANQRRGSAALGEIGGDDRRRCAEPAQLLGQRLHRREAARAQHQVVAVPGQLARERRADPARRAGDKGDGAIVALHGRPMILSASSTL